MRWQALDGRGRVEAVVTTRHGGVSIGAYASLNLGLHVGDDIGAVVENRRRAAATVGLELDDLVFCAQSHGRKVAEVRSADRGRGAYSMADAIPDADALVTSDADVGLVVMVADCVPMVLFDPGTPSLACVHAGWRGTVARVAEAAVERLMALGAQRDAIVAAIGPAIDRTRYQVGEEVAQLVHETFGDEAGDVIEPDDHGRWRFDLWHANQRVLTEAGVAPENITLADIPTGPGTPFFSDRSARPCGRFAAIARLRPTPS